MKSLDDAPNTMAQLRDRLANGLRDAIGGELTFNGVQAERLPNTLSVNFPNVQGSDLLNATSELCASTGSACHSGATRMSATLKAIGLKEEVALGTVRLSLGWYTTQADVDRAIDLLVDAWERLAQK